MATPAQIRANRANAQLSTGPRSEAGRQITRFNALKHGLAAKELVIPGEDPAALDALRADLIAEHQPAGPTEALLVEELAVCWWRLQRARKEETSMVRGVVAANKFYDSPIIVGALRYTIAAERAWNRALANLRTAQSDRRKHSQDIAEAAPPPQPQETEKVMAVGSVPQSCPESSEPEPGPVPEVPPAPITNDEPLTTAAAVSEQDAQRRAKRQELTVRRAQIDDFLANMKREMASFRK